MIRTLCSRLKGHGFDCLAVKLSCDDPGNVVVRIHMRLSPSSIVWHYWILATVRWCLVTDWRGLACTGYPGMLSIHEIKDLQKSPAHIDLPFLGEFCSHR